MLLGWTPDVALSMPARRLFAVLHKARDLDEKKMSRMVLRFVDVAWCGQSTPEFARDLKRATLMRIDPELAKVPTLSNRDAFMMFNNLQRKVARG